MSKTTRSSTAAPQAPDLASLQDDIRSIYCSDERPWVIGYSGGKDSTTALQLIWSAIAALPASERKKTIYVISSDTLVETPVVSRYIDVTLERIAEAAGIRPRRGASAGAPNALRLNLPTNSSNVGWPNSAR